MRALHPADLATLAILLVVTVTLGVSWAAGRPLAGDFALHAAVLAGYALLARALRGRRAGVVRGVAVIAAMFTLYTTLGHVAFAAVPWLADPWLEAADRALFPGPSPVLALAPLAATPWAEFLAFFYAAFIPYLYASILLSLVGRPEGERDEFVTGFAVLYALSFLGYLFLPARGPVVQMAALFPGPVEGGTFHALVVRSVASMGGPHGAFPSLHVGASFFAMWFDFRHRAPLRGLVYLPLVALIVLATMVLRYHYAVDLAAGVGLALLASAVARRALGAGTRAPAPGPAGAAYRAVRGMWKAALFGFFRRVDAQGVERVPARGPLLLVANHTNAFVDPLLILTALERPVTLTAKSTLRKNPLLRPIVAAMGVIELHRAQDLGAGADPARNAAALEACRRRLAEGGAVVVFPEGVSHSDPGLRPFRSGAARIALDFAAEHPAPLRVVPVGLHFEAKERFRSAAGVLFGEPLDVAEWRALHPEAGPAELTAEIEARIRALTANFEAERDVETFARAADLLETGAAPPAPLGLEEPADLRRRVDLIRRLQEGRDWLAATRAEELASLEGRVRALDRKVRRLGITLPELFLPLDAPRAAFFTFRELELLLVGAPLAAWGWLNHLLPYSLLRALVRKASTDRDHFASNSVFFGLPVVPLFWILQTLAVSAFAGPFWTVLYALSLPFSAAVALLYRDRSGGAWRRARTFFLFLRHPDHRRRLLAEARSILDDLRRLADEFDAHAAPSRAL